MPHLGAPTIKKSGRILPETIFRPEAIAEGLAVAKVIVFSIIHILLGTNHATMLVQRDAIAN